MQEWSSEFETKDGRMVGRLRFLNNAKWSKLWWLCIIPMHQLHRYLEHKVRQREALKMSSIYGVKP